MFGFKKRRAERQAEEQAQAKEQLRQAIVEMIALAEGGPGVQEGGPLILQSGGRLVYRISGAGLYEPRRGPGHWSGQSAGFSIPVGEHGYRFRVGKTAGHYVQGDEKPTIIDQGDASITTSRVVFQGAKYTREWDWSKLIGIVNYSDQSASAIQVSNRQKTSGIVYAGSPVDAVRLRLAVAAAIFECEGERVAKELHQALRELDAGQASHVTDLFNGAQPEKGKDAMP
jgi:hypothetical protein